MTEHSCAFCRHYWWAMRTLCVRCGGWRWFRHDLLCRRCSVIVERQTAEDDAADAAAEGRET